MAYLSYYLHWSREAVMGLDHLERQRWVREVARMNEEINRSSGADAPPLPSGFGGR